MADTKDKVEEEKPPDIKKTTEYKRFRRLLKQVIKAPSMRKSVKSNINPIVGSELSNH